MCNKMYEKEQLKELQEQLINYEKIAIFGDVYNPLIDAAKDNNPMALDMLVAVGALIFKHNPTKCNGVEDGVEAAKRNLDYYCQYFDECVVNKVKSIYGLGDEFRDIKGQKRDGVI